MNITDALKNGMNKHEKAAIEKMQKSAGWSVLHRFANKIISKLDDDVDNKLPADEYKIANESRRKAKAVIGEIFDIADVVAELSKKEKIDYS